MSHPQEPVLDREGLLDRVDGDRSLLLDMIQIFMEQVPGLTDTLRRAVAEGDAQALRRTAHTIKGVTGELAAPNARRLAMTLEDLGETGRLPDAPAVLADLEAELERLRRDLALLAEDQT
jgi:HPt (histidine-containing phosphotransfer) domain-containing protein